MLKDFSVEIKTTAEFYAARLALELLEYPIFIGTKQADGMDGWLYLGWTVCEVSRRGVVHKNHFDNLEDFLVALFIDKSEDASKAAKRDAIELKLKEAQDAVAALEKELSDFN